jgi:hypothetical protein
MELEEMKDLWGEMSAEIGKQKKITGSLIIKMTKADYRNKINKILVPELISALVAFVTVLFILINLQKLNTPYLLVCGIIAALILFILPLLSINAIRKMRSVNIMENNYKQSLLEYSKGKMQFVFVQKLSFYLGAVLMLVSLPVMGQLIGGVDFFKKTNLWLYYAVSFPFFYLFANWVFKYYIRSTKDAENILKELDN